MSLTIFTTLLISADHKVSKCTTIKPVEDFVVKMMEDVKFVNKFDNKLHK